MVNENKLRDTLRIILEHLKEQDAQVWALSADIAALRSCVSVYPEIETRYQAQLQVEQKRIAPTLRTSADAYDAIIAQLKDATGWTH